MRRSAISCRQRRPSGLLTICITNFSRNWHRFHVWHLTSRSIRKTNALLFSSNPTCQRPAFFKTSQTWSSLQHGRYRPESLLFAQATLIIPCLSLRTCVDKMGFPFSAYGRSLASSLVIRTARTNYGHSRPRPADIRLVFTRNDTAEALPLFDTRQNGTICNKGDGQPQKSVSPCSGRTTSMYAPALFNTSRA